MRKICTKKGKFKQKCTHNDNFNYTKQRLQLRICKNRDKLGK